MKSFREFINESEILAKLDEFDSRTLSHIAIEYLDKCYPYMNWIVSEKYGVYDGLPELCSIITKKIKKKIRPSSWDKEYKIYLEFDRDDFKDIPNIFFKKAAICVYVQEGKLYGSYFPVHNLDKDKLMKKVQIDIYIEDAEDAYSTLMHEFTHAYEDWNRLIKGDTYFRDIFDTRFFKIIQPGPIDDEYVTYLKQVMYFVMNIEQNAFASELASELRKYKDEIKTPLDALEVLKESPIYQAYKSLYTKLMTFADKDSDDDWVKNITVIYNQISNTNYEPPKVMKKLKYLIQKSLKKFDSIIGKLCVDSLNNPAYLIDNFNHSRIIASLKE